MAIAPKGSNAITADSFSLTIDEYEIGSFSELLGIHSEVEPARAEVTGATPVHRVSGLGTLLPPTVALKRAQDDNLEIWAWHENVRVGHIDARRDCQLTVLNSDGNPVAEYYLKNAWPSTLDVGSLTPGTPEVLAEMVTLTCESITRVNP